MKDKIQEINEEIVKLQTECGYKIGKLVQKRDKLIKEQNPQFLNPYIKYKDGKSEYVCKIIDVSYFTNGEVNYYTVKILAIKGEPYYHPNYTINLYKLEDDCQFISEIEFEELLEKGLKLIKKDII